MKIYTSKAGLKFQINATQRPATNGAVSWTQSEFDWIKAQNLAPEEYQLIHHLKLENYLYSPIPEVETSEAARLANIYAAKIKKQLTSNNGVDKAEEVRQQENGKLGLLLREQIGGGDPQYPETAGEGGGDRERPHPGEDTPHQS